MYLSEVIITSIILIFILGEHWAYKESNSDVLGSSYRKISLFPQVFLKSFVAFVLV